MLGLTLVPGWAGWGLRSAGQRRFEVGRRRADGLVERVRMMGLRVGDVFQHSPDGMWWRATEPPRMERGVAGVLVESALG